MLVDDGSASVSLPELPLLAVLPGTGGLTRVSDKRKVRRDHADVFCTTEEGVKGKRAVEWRLVDDVVPGSKFDETVAARAKEFAAQVAAQRRRQRYHAHAADAHIRRGRRRIRLALGRIQPRRAHRHHHAARARPRRRRLPPTPWWRRAQNSGRCSSRASSTTRSSTSGSTSSTSPRSCSNPPASRRRFSPTTISSTPTRITGWRAKSAICGSACSSASISPRARWSRLIEPGSCFAGTLAELPFASDRSYMLIGARDGDNKPPATHRARPTSISAPIRCRTG